MIKYTKAAEIAMNSLHPLDKERTESLISRLEKNPKLAENATFLTSSRQTRILPISTELVLLIERQGETITIQDVTTSRRLESVDSQATAT